MRKPFHATCVGWPHEVAWLIHLQEQAEEIGRSAFLKLVDAVDMKAAEASLGYAAPRARGLKMADDLHVRYFLEPATRIPFFVHSAIEFVFATTEDIDALGRNYEDSLDSATHAGPEAW